MTPDEFSKWSITHKSRKTLKTQQTILVGTSSIPNKSQAGRHTAKQGVFCSQYRFLLLSLFIGGLNHNLQKSLKTGSRSQTSTNAQHRANNPVGYTLVFCLQIAHRAKYGKTGRYSSLYQPLAISSSFIFPLVRRTLLTASRRISSSSSSVKRFVFAITRISISS